MKIRLLILTTIFSAFAFFAHANNGIECGTKPPPDLSGGVVDASTKKPLSNVNVTAVSHDSKETWKSVTDQNGNYSFTNIKSGYYKLTFFKDGFRKITKEKVYLREDENNQLNIEMITQSDFQIIPGFIIEFD